MWQDYILMFWQWIFIVILLPSLFTDQKPHILTSSFTSIGLFTFGVIYYSLELFWASIPTFIHGVGWLILAVQKYKLKGLGSIY